MRRVGRHGLLLNESGVTARPGSHPRAMVPLLTHFAGMHLPQGTRRHDNWFLKTRDHVPAIIGRRLDDFFR
jgi:hypothetical protein